MKKIAIQLTGLLLVLSCPCTAQVAFSVSGAPTPDPSSLLDIQATNKGMLVPRMSTVQRTTTIASPAEGLLVYDTDTRSFWYFKTGAGWQQIPGTGFTLPYSGTASAATPLFSITNTGTGGGLDVQMTNTGSSGTGINVNHLGGGTGIFSSVSGGQAMWAITGSSFSSALLADNSGHGEAVTGRTSANGISGNPGAGVAALVGRNDSTGIGVKGFTTGTYGYGVVGLAGYGSFAGHPATGVAGRFENFSATNSSSALEVATNGTGRGIKIDLTNASNGSNGIEVNQNGTGNGVFVNAAVGQALWGITNSSFSSAVLADNTAHGEAVTGRTTANGIPGNPGAGVAALVGRNDSTGVGVKGFTTGSFGYGVVGLAGYSSFAGHPATGVAGRFENMSPGNPATALEAVTNGNGYAGSFSGTGSSSQGILIAAGAGQKAIKINSGRMVYATTTYASGAFPTDYTVVACNNGVASASTPVALPAAEDGTMLIIVGADPDGVSVTGMFSGATTTVAVGAARLFIRANGAWFQEF